MAVPEVLSPFDAISPIIGYGVRHATRMAVAAILAFAAAWALTLPESYWAVDQHPPSTLTNLTEKCVTCRCIDRRAKKFSSISNYTKVLIPLHSPDSHRC